jgi:ferredoxin-NADP reductase
MSDPDTFTVRVKQIQYEADGVVSLLLTPVDGGALPAVEPGAHVRLDLGEGLRRQYSLCGDPARRDAYRVAVRLDAAGRGGSRYVHERLRAGDLLPITVPRNRFSLVEGSEYLFVAGGIGITPLLPMIEAVERAGARWSLAYAGRTRAGMAFVDDLARHGDRVTLHVADQGGRLSVAEVLATAGPATEVYCCGPERLLAEVESLVADPARLHVERFAGTELDEPVLAGAFEVECHGSGAVLTVGPEQTVLEALEQAGEFVDSDCREGICGSCEVKVLAGRPDHRDGLLSPEERAANDRMMVCVSRSLDPRLVLDV